MKNLLFSLHVCVHVSCVHVCLCACVLVCMCIHAKEYAYRYNVHASTNTQCHCTCDDGVHHLEIYVLTYHPFCNFYRLGVPEQALGGIPLGFGIVVEDRSF